MKVKDAKQRKKGWEEWKWIKSLERKGITKGARKHKS